MDAELAEEFSIPPIVFSKEEERLKDDVRVRAFRRVILQNKHLFEGKVVLDVGCGCGFLSLLCAKAGAKAVYAIDDTDIVSMTKDIVAQNRLESVIQVFKVEDITKTQLPEEKVDIIVSDWMGYFLFLRSRVEMLIAARDRWLVCSLSLSLFLSLVIISCHIIIRPRCFIPHCILHFFFWFLNHDSKQYFVKNVVCFCTCASFLQAPNGRVFPDQATLHICGMEDEVFKDERVNFWENVLGFDMSPMKSLALRVCNPILPCHQAIHFVSPFPRHMYPFVHAH
jgi:SAM-dependent methyltransferase